MPCGIESNPLIDGQTSTVFCLYFATNLRVFGVIWKPHRMRRLAQIKTGAETQRLDESCKRLGYGVRLQRFSLARSAGARIFRQSVRLLAASRGMLGDVEPAAARRNRYTVLQNHPAKHRFVVPRNPDIDVRIDIHATCGEPQLLENPRFNTLYIKVGVHPLHEPEPERLRGANSARHARGR